MGEDPRHIQQQIDETRERMGDTVGALAGKADVPGRVKGSVAAKKDAVTDRLSGARERMPDAGRAAHRGAGMAQENPIGLAVGALAVGFLAGTLLPATRVEDQKMGELSDEVIDRAKETGQEALERGKQVAQEAAQSAQETAKESGQQHAQELKGSAQEQAQEAASSARS
jgi:murein DD-endopeptidase MepM/ murein hydrolase activator NlpD